MRARNLADGDGSKQDGHALALHLGALGDLVLALPAIAALAPVEVRGPSLERLTVALAPRGPAARGRLLGHELFASLPDGEDLSLYRRVVAFAADDGGPLAARVRAANGLLIPPRPPEGVHATDHFLSFVAPPDVRRHPVIRPTPEDLAAARALVPSRPFLVAQPGSGGLAKRWPPSSFEEALAPLRERFSIIVVLGPAELDPPDPRLRLGCADRIVEAPSLATLVGILSLARGYVGNDAGVTHLAAALGTPTVAVFGPTDPRSWAPRGPSVAVLVAPEPRAVTGALVGLTGSPRNV